MSCRLLHNYEAISDYFLVGNWHQFCIQLNTPFRWDFFLSQIAKIITSAWN